MKNYDWQNTIPSREVDQIHKLEAKIKQLQEEIKVREENWQKRAEHLRELRAENEQLQTELDRCRNCEVCSSWREAK